MESKETISREELYELVWDEPLTSLSKKYNASEEELRDICKNMNIPVPRMWYWIKLQNEKRVHKTPLPQGSTNLQEISLSLRPNEDKEEEPQPTFLSELNRIKKEIEETVSITIPTTLHTKNPLIQSTKEYFSAPNGQKIDKLHLDIWTSTKDLRNRALCFMIAFIDAMEARGHQVITKGNKTFAVVSEEEFQIYMREKSTTVIVDKEAKYSWGRQKLVPSGKLCFRYYHSYKGRDWADTEFVPIEDKISHIIAYFEAKAVEEKRERKEREEYWRKRDEKEREEKELQERKDKELEDFMALFALSNRYQKAIEIRTYIETVKSQFLKNDDSLEEVQIWIEWASKKADWIDPFVNAEDEYLDDDDKNEIDACHNQKTTGNSASFSQDPQQSWFSRPWWSK